jgi:hypothetical protein
VNTLCADRRPHDAVAPGPPYEVPLLLRMGFVVRGEDSEPGDDLDASPGGVPGRLTPGPDPAADRFIDEQTWRAALLLARLHTVPAADQPAGRNTGRRCGVVPERAEAERLVMLACATWCAAGRDQREFDATGVHPAQRLTAERMLIIVRRLDDGQAACPELDAIREGTQP